MSNNTNPKDKIFEQAKELRLEDQLPETVKNKMIVRSRIKSNISVAKLNELAKEVLSNINKEYDIKLLLYNLNYGPEKLGELKKLTADLEIAETISNKSRRDKTTFHKYFLTKLKETQKEFDLVLRILEKDLKGDKLRQKVITGKAYKVTRIYDKIGKMYEYSNELKNNTAMKNELIKYCGSAQINLLIEKTDETSGLYKDYRHKNAISQKNTEIRNFKKKALLLWFRRFHDVCKTKIGKSQMLELLGIQISQHKTIKPEADNNRNDRGDTPDVSPNVTDPASQTQEG